MKQIFFTLFSFFFINLNFSQCLSGDCINGVGMYDHGSATYEGSFVNGIKNGYGKLINNFDGELWVEGEWIDGIYYGDGRILKDGNIYAGYLEDDILRLNNSEYESLLIIKNLNIFEDVNTNLYSIIEVINSTTSDEVLKVALLKLNSLLFEDPDYTVDYINDDILQFAADINKEKALEIYESDKIEIEKIDLNNPDNTTLFQDDEYFKIYSCGYFLCRAGLNSTIDINNHELEDEILFRYTEQEYPLTMIYQLIDLSLNFNQEVNEDPIDKWSKDLPIVPDGDNINSKPETQESEDIIETYRYKNETTTKCKWCTKDIVCRKKTESELIQEENYVRLNQELYRLAIFYRETENIVDPDLIIESKSGVTVYKVPVYLNNCPDFCSTTCEKIAESRK